ncbi:MAG: winged helix-turn-helix domain-containing protein [Bacteroidota bacterium]
MTPSLTSLVDTPPFHIEGWQFEPALLRAASGDDTRQLEPKVMAVLCVLAARPGTPVTRQEFYDEVWAGVVVTDDVLTRAISELRKLFDDRARPSRVIETVPRIGYRLVASVEPVGASDPPDPGTSPVAAPPPRWGHSTVGTWPIFGVGTLLVAVALGVGYAIGNEGTSGEAPYPVVPVTAEPGFEMAPALSPDGQRLAFVHSVTEAGHLVVSDADGTGWLRLTEGAARAWAPTWSPDGTALAFVSYRGESCTIQTLPALGGPMTRLGACPAEGNTEIDWSPDGQYLAVSTVQGTEGLPVRRLDLATGAVDTLAYDWQPGIEDWSPRFSPDGTRLLVVRNESGREARLAVIDLSDGNVRRIETPSGLIVGHDWLDDERVIVSVLKEQTTLWTASVRGDTPTWLPVSSPWTFRLTASGGRVVAEQWASRGAIRRTSLGDLASRTPIAPSTARDYFPTWSPDERQIAFLSDRTGAIELWTADADGARLRQVTRSGTLLSPPRWSSTGRLAYAARVDGESDVFLIDTEGAEPRQLALPGSNESHPNWSPDGQWLYVRSDRGGKPTIWKVPVGGGEPIRITTEGAVAARPSPDGRWLYVVRQGSADLWRQPLNTDGDATTVAERVYDRTVPSRPHLWVPFDGGVYVADRQTGGTYDLVRIDTTGTRQRLGQLSEDAMSGFDVAPTSGGIVIGAVTDRGADLIRMDLRAAE